MANTSTNINARVFAPYVVVGGDEKTRLLFTLKSSEGYTMDAGITLGDVIRYSPSTNSYVRSKANTDENAEIVGVVESISGDAYNVVGHGSIKYPASRLSAITQGGEGGVDVLFLDENVDGGLTGTINVSAGEKLVKPVLQVAPHGEYNARVLNYIGYKTGNKAVLELDKDIVPLGTIVFSAFGNYADDSWIPVPTAPTLGGVSIFSTNVFSVNISDYPDLWNYYSVINSSSTFLRYSYRIKLDTPFDIQYLGKISQSIQRFSVLDSSGEIVSDLNGFIIFDATDTNYIELMVTDPDRADFIEVNLGPYLKDSSYSITGSFDVSGGLVFTLSTNGNSLNYLKRFLPPPVNPNKIPTVSQFSNMLLIPWLKAKKDSFLVRVPTALTIDTLKIDTSIELTGTNLETRLAAIESKLANICTNIGLGC